MNYKKIIRSRKVRIWILQMLGFVPDKMMVKIQYRMKTGRKLNLKEPQRFTEKLQWYKLYYRDQIMKECADKYEVRRYVEACGLGEILNELYGVYNTPEEIDFDKLPESFVLKDTLGGGGNSVILVGDKNRMDAAQVRQKMDEWVSQPVKKKHFSREWVYDGRKHRIIAEKYIESDKEQGGLIDYKFFCFYGKAEYLYVIADRELGKKAGLAIYDIDFNRIDAMRSDEERLHRIVKRPDNYSELVHTAEKLAGDFPEARIDLYDIQGKIIFGEITFFDGSGYMCFEPDEFDFEMGRKFVIKKDNYGSR